eukprot:g3075.t1
MDKTDSQYSFRRLSEESDRREQTGEHLELIALGDTSDEESLRGSPAGREGKKSFDDDLYKDGDQALTNPTPTYSGNSLCPECCQGKFCDAVDNLLGKIIPGPRCVRNILGSEACERFSWYGLRAILVSFMTDVLKWNQGDAVLGYSLAAALAYFMPLIGGYVSDTYLGKYKTILYFSVVYCSGSLLLACSALSSDGIPALMVIGLVLVGIGTGGIKPCVSAFGADQFPEHQVKQKVLFFSAFYFSINFGSIASYALTPLLKRYLGYVIAFGAPFCTLGLATFVFWSGRKFYRITPPTSSMLGRVCKVYYTAWNLRGKDEGSTTNDLTLSLGNEAQSTRDLQVDTFGPLNWIDRATRAGDRSCTRADTNNAKALWHILPIIAILPSFWMLFDQQGSVWLLQAKNMSTGFLEPEQFGIINPLALLCLIPLFDSYIYPSVERLGIRTLPLRRIGVGMIFSSAAFIVSGLVQLYLNTQPPQSVTVWLQIPQILLISIGEVLISITSLSFCYEESSPAMKSIIAALNLLTVTIGDLLGGLLFKAMSDMPRATFFFVCASLMILNFLVFLFIASKFKSVVRN